MASFFVVVVSVAVLLYVLYAHNVKTVSVASGKFNLVGAEAKKLYEEAQAMLKKIAKEGLLVAHGVVGLFPARSRGDDIVVLSEDSGSSTGVLYGLRQQVCLHVVLF